MTSDEALSFLVAKAKSDVLHYLTHDLTLGSLATEKRKGRSWCTVPGRGERQGGGRSRGPEASTSRDKAESLAYTPNGMRSSRPALRKGLISSNSGFKSTALWEPSAGAPRKKEGDECGGYSPTQPRDRGHP